MSCAQKAAATLQWQGQGLPCPRTAQRFYLRQHLFGDDKSFPGKLFKGRQYDPSDQVHCNQNKLAVVMSSNGQ